MEKLTWVTFMEVCIGWFEVTYQDYPSKREEDRQSSGFKKE
jgi:hypothetical protein